MAGLLTLALLGWSTAAHATAVRVALASLDDEAGLTAPQLERLRDTIRGAALDRAHLAPRLALPPGASSHRCDPACWAALALDEDAAFVVTGRVTRLAAGALEVVLELHRVDAATSPLAVERALGAEGGGLIVALTDAADRLLARVPAAPAVAPPPVATPAPPPAAAPAPPPAAPPAVMAREEMMPPSTKSPAAAFALELMLPTAGLFYAEAYEAAGFVLAATAGGVVLIVLGAEDGAGNVDQLVLGLLVLIGARAYALGAAPALASSYNTRQQRKWRRRHLERPEDGALLAPRPPSLVLSAPALRF